MPNPAPAAVTWRSRTPAVVVLAVLIAGLAIAFTDILEYLVFKAWGKEEYSHCYLIPAVALFMIAVRSRELTAVPWTGSPWGLALVGVGFVLLAISRLSAVYTLGEIGLVIAIWGCFLAVLGPRAVHTIWPALLYLAFMVPLPDFIGFRMSTQLQLWSSQLGVLVIRAAGIPVFLSGNVIDLGVYQLQVAEACSGMRYLFPLASFGFLCASLFTAPAWQRIVLFLSTAPITVLMNSFRVGVIGILVNRWGIEQAEGFLHDFEGWVVFMACVGVLFLEMAVMARLSGRRLLKSLQLDTPPLAELGRMVTAPRAPALTVTALAVTAALAISAGIAGSRPEMIPERARLVTFPLVMGEWRGEDVPVNQVEVDSLQASDTLSLAFARPNDVASVAMWISYYDSQRSGRSVHSPAVCLPGGGWQVESLEPFEVPAVRADGAGLTVNRGVVRMGNEQLLVYYWFPQRGRMLTNEYVVKWYIFWDGMTTGRSDGALVRLVTPVTPTENLEQAEERLQAFLRAVDPKLAYYLPPGEAPAAAVADASP